MKKCHVTQRLAVKTSSIAIAEFHQDKRHTYIFTRAKNIRVSFF